MNEKTPFTPAFLGAMAGTFLAIVFVAFIRNSKKFKTTCRDLYKEITPKKSLEEMTIDELREVLQVLIDEEYYENATKLRDLIRDIKNEAKKNND